MSTKSDRPAHIIPPLALDPIVIREARPSDSAALGRLAERDSAVVPQGEILVGEIDGELLAAVRLDGGPSIADPFHRTADLLALLETRAGQLRNRRRRSARVVARTPAPAPGPAPALQRRALA